MTLFTESGACHTRVHCRTCRDREKGRAWRESLKGSYALPNGEVDFPCPHGGDWGKPPPSRGVGDTVAKVLHSLGAPEGCTDCLGRQDDLNRRFPFPGE